MRYRWSSFFALALVLSFVPRAPATIDVSNYFASHMVLQRGGPITVYGTGASGEIVTATLNGGSISAATNSSGTWLLSLPAQTAGGPYSLVLAGPSNTVTLTDMLIGDLWLASGQSNMSFLMRPYSPYTFGVLNYQSEIAAANYPNLRVFTTTTKYPDIEATRVYGSWTVCSPSTAGNYSAIAYYFGRKLQTQLGVPIGMVVSALGSTSINSWIDKVTLANLGTATTGTGEFDPGNCFNGMIAPLTSIPMKGFIWAQGEADTTWASGYAARTRALINDWRSRWKNPNMPFYDVQLANYDPT
jgi:sialate O-acetylesterase